MPLFMRRFLCCVWGSPASKIFLGRPGLRRPSFVSVCRDLERVSAQLLWPFCYLRGKAGCKAVYICPAAT